MKRLPWGRIVAGVVGAVALVLGSHFLARYVGFSQAMTGVEVAEPMRLRVDLSRPGEYVGELDQTASFTCKQVLRVETAKPFASSEDARAALAGLSGHLAIKDAGGKVVYETEVNPEAFWVDPAGPDFRPGFLFSPIPRGKYKVVLSVQQGAPALNDIRQELVGRYLLCGIERIQAAFLGAAALVSFTVCGAMALVIVVVTKRKRSVPVSALGMRDTAPGTDA